MVRQGFVEWLLTGLGVSGTAVLQGMEVSAFVVRATLFPTDKKDADPLKGQGSDGDVVSFTSSALSLIKALCPRAITDGTSRELMKRLT